MGKKIILKKKIKKLKKFQKVVDKCESICYIRKRCFEKEVSNMWLIVLKTSHEKKVKKIKKSIDL